LDPRPTPQEIYLLERYISLEYFAELRDTWARMVTHVETCLNAFSQNFPGNYRSRPLPEQPDIVWGNRVLPNFRDTLQGLNTGYILLTHGDVKGLHFAWGPRSDFKGQMDYWSGWMGETDEDLYSTLLNQALTLAKNIATTEGAYWNPRSLIDYSAERGPLNPPAQWPSYRVNRAISVASGETLKQSGIYLPDIDNSGAQFLSTRYKEAPLAWVLVGMGDVNHPLTGEKIGQQKIVEKRDCVWYLVERSTDALQDAPAPSPAEPQRRRLAAGERCPESGFYFTPASSGSRRRFEVGDIMPGFDSTYGATFWQWDKDQT